MPRTLDELAYPFGGGDFDESCGCKFACFPQIRGLFATVGRTANKLTSYPEFADASDPPRYYTKIRTTYQGYNFPDEFATFWEQNEYDFDAEEWVFTESDPPFTGWDADGFNEEVEEETPTYRRTTWTRYGGDDSVESKLIKISVLSAEHTTEMITNDVLDNIDDFPADFPGTHHTGGSLTVGHDYVLLTLGAGADFTGVGLALNEVGMLFNASGTSPTWGTGSVLAEYPIATSPPRYFSGTGSASGGWAVSSGICYALGAIVWDSTGYIPAAWRWLKDDESGFTLVRCQYCLALPKLAGPGSFTVEWDEQFFPPTESGDPDIPGQPDWDNPGDAAGQSFDGDETTRQTDAQTIPDPTDNGYVFVKNARYTAIAA